MKLLRFSVGGQQRLGLAIESRVYDLADIANLLALPLPSTIREAMQLTPYFWRDVVPRLEANRELALNIEDLTYAPVVANPQKILCVGLNYRDHARESKMEVSFEPVLFGKFGNALAAHGQAIALPQSGRQIDYEAELVAVIGRRARYVSEGDALDYVFGYTVGNDLSIRDAQFRTGQWLIGKTFDAFAPVGPWIVTADAVDPADLTITCRVNGQLRQKASTADMIFSVARIISHASRYMTLEPGDLIFTGPPAGVAMGYPEGQQPWLQSGDQVVCEIENIGKLVNYIR